jgi:hypothetical protein
VTFAEEPGIYIPGELGIRHEGDSCENLPPKRSGRPEEPAVV